MDYFYIIVSTIAVVILIILLTYIGIVMSKSGFNMPTFPPNYNTCPDFWEEMDGKCIIPASASNKNAGTIYNTDGSFKLNSSNTPGFIPRTSETGSKNMVDFTNSTWGTGSTARCKIQKWANNYGLLFDGVTNFSDC